MALADTAELIVALKLRDGLSGGLGKLNSQLKGMQGGLSQVGKGIGQIGGGLDKIATRGAIAAGAGLAGVITTAASFEQAWAGVEKTVDGANDALLNDFKRLSTQIPLSFEELAGIGAEGGALGIATKDLVNFTDIVARLAVSTDLSVEQASSSLGQLANVLHLDDADLRDFGDSLVALGNDGASTESQIIDLTARFGAAGKQAGLSNEAILALASTTASMAIEAEAGGGALSRIFNGITLDIGTASDESQALADAMGMSLAELRTAWDHDAGKVFGDLLGYVNKLDKFESAAFLSDLGITNTRDINAITLLASGVEEYNRQLAVSEGQTDELNRESDAFFDTTAMKWETLQNHVRLAADSIGSQLLPIVNDAMEDFGEWLSLPETQTGIADFGRDLAGGVREAVDAIKGADLGPLLEVVKGAADGAKAAFGVFRDLPPGVQSLALAAFGINKLTGGALTDIAKGFGNILGGGLKLAIPALSRGITPGNPMYVKEVGLGGAGGPLGGGKGGGLLGGALKLIPAVLAAEIADELEPSITQLGVDMHHELGFDQDWNPLRNLSPADLQWPFGPKNTPTILPEIFGGNGVLGGTGSTNGRARAGDFMPPAPHPDPRGRSPEARAIEEALSADRVLLQKIVKSPAVLPDTAMAPVTSAVSDLRPILANTQAEMLLGRIQTAAKLLSVSTGIATSNAKLDTANARLGTIAAKDFNPTIVFNPKLSTTVIQYQSGRLAALQGNTRRLF